MGEIIGDFGQAGEEGFVGDGCGGHSPPYGLEAEDDAVGGSDTDGRGSADAELFDGFPGGFDGAAFVVDQFDGESGLIDEDEVTVVVTDPAEGLDIGEHGGNISHRGAEAQRGETGNRTRGNGDKETRGQGDTGTRGQGDKGTRDWAMRRDVLKLGFL